MAGSRRRSGKSEPGAHPDHLNRRHADDTRTSNGHHTDALIASWSCIPVPGWADDLRAQPREDAVPLYDHLGALHHPITTTHPKAQQYFDQGLRLVYAFNHEEAINSFAQALTFDEAKQEQDRLAQLTRSLPKDRTDGVASIVDLAQIATDVLAGEIAARQSHLDEAVEHLRRAVNREDRLRYYEPSLWHYPVRHSLGALLLAAGRAAEAERVYREDLKQHPENGWALYGLKESLLVQGQREEAAAVEQRFHQAWARADIQLNASRM